MNYNVQKTAGIIKELRRTRGTTQEKVAEDMGINIKTYQAVEQGSRGMSIDTLCIIAGYYTISLNYLVNGQIDTAEWDSLLKNLSEDQKTQMFMITSNMIRTLGWDNSHKEW